MKIYMFILLIGMSFFDIVHSQILPPELSWKGGSERFIRSKSDPWVTPAERSNLTRTPDYSSTIKWLHRLVDHSPYLTMQKIGKSSQNRDLWLIVASKEGVKVASEFKRNKRPTLLFHAGIHSGEIDGKDAGMMFLRDIVLDRSTLLDSINIIFIPVLNPDGHERSSNYNRVNQRGPEEMGWRTNARNLNLNRDFTKAETPEIRALLKVINVWPIDIYIDIHVTDGIDYQYDITFGFNYANSYSPNISQWLQNEMRPFVNQELSRYGHIPGPLIFAKDNKNLESGIVNWSAPPRFSNGYGDARHLPTILVENHSLKSFKQRVLGTYVFLNSICRLLASHGGELLSMTTKDALFRPNILAIGMDWMSTKRLPESFPFLGIAYKTYESSITGTKEVEWLGKPSEFSLPIYIVQPKHEIRPPTAYWIPSSRNDIIKKLQLHGIEMTIINESVTREVELVRIESHKLDTEPYEGRVLVNIDSLKSENQLRNYPPGSARVPTDQPLGILAMLLLEPQADDSFLQWGYFHEIFQRTEYIEGYAVVPLAEKMLQDSPGLRIEFNIALQDTSFANDPAARLQWFYRRSPYYDNEYLIYPVGREN